MKNHNLLTVLKDLEEIKASEYLLEDNEELRNTYETFMVNELEFWRDYQLSKDVKDYVVLLGANYEMEKFTKIYHSAEKQSERNEGYKGTF